MTRKRIKGGARLRDVAAAAGVSKSTASAVINDRAGQYGISPETQDRVRAAARQLGYTPSLAALDMSAGRNSLIGLVLAAGYPGGDGLVMALEEACSRAGFRLMVSGIPSDPQEAMQHITGLSQFGVAGIVICSPDAIPVPKIGCPAVRIGKAGAGLPAVYEDVMDGGRKLARRLLDRGHRTLGIIGAAMHAPEEDAVRGFLDSCAEVGAAVRRFTSVAEFIAGGDAVTAVFCASSSSLLELYVNGAGVGRSPGLDFGVVAIDCQGVAESLRPRPVVLRHGLDQLTQGAVQLIQQAMQGSAPDIRLAPVIVEGDIIPAPPSVSEAVPPPVKSPPLVIPPPYRQPVSPPASAAPTRPVASPVVVAKMPSEPVQMDETGGQTPLLSLSGSVSPSESEGQLSSTSAPDQVPVVDPPVIIPVIAEPVPVPDPVQPSDPQPEPPTTQQPNNPAAELPTEPEPIPSPVADPLPSLSGSVSPSESNGQTPPAEGWPTLDQDVGRGSVPGVVLPEDPAVEIPTTAPIADPAPEPVAQPVVVEAPVPLPVIAEAVPDPVITVADPKPITDNQDPAP